MSSYSPTPVRRRRTTLAAGLGGLLLSTPAAGLGLGLRNYKNQGTLAKKNTARARVQQMTDLLHRPPGQAFMQKNLGPHRVNTSKDMLKLAQLHSVVWDPMATMIPQRRLVWGDKNIQFFKPRDFFLHMASLYSAEATSLTAAADPYGIAPGTHLASRFTDALPLFASKGKRWIKHSSYAGNSTKGLENDTFLSLYHHVIYLGNGLTFGFPEGLGTLSHFMKGNKAYYEIVYPGSSTDKKSIFRRVAHAFTEGLTRPNSDFSASKYNVIKRNCEHLATYIMTGKATSLQVSRAEILLIGLGTAYAAAVLAKAVFFVRKISKIMRKWGFKSGMRRNAIDQVYDRQKRKYSFLNSIRGRIPKELVDARNAALSTSKL
jgi:hypothetical protein